MPSFPTVPPPLLTATPLPTEPGLLLVLRGMHPPPPPPGHLSTRVERGGFPGGKATRHDRRDTPAQSVHLCPSSQVAPERTHGLARRARRRGKTGHREEMRREDIDGGKESLTSPRQSLPPHIGTSSSCREQGAAGNASRGRRWLLLPGAGWVTGGGPGGCAPSLSRNHFWGGRWSTPTWSRTPRAAGTDLLPGTHPGPKPPAERGNGDTIPRATKGERLSEQST